MGMDVYGIAPTSPDGEYFRNNVWWWRPLADYCIEVGAAVANKCKGWHTNDGEGLNATDSQKLCAILENEIASGRCLEYSMAHETRRKGFEKVTCRLCHGTGIRTDEVGRNMKHHEKKITEPVNHPRLGQIGWCNWCDGEGTIESVEAWYHFSVENVENFVKFLHHCGGFSIN